MLVRDANGKIHIISRSSFDTEGLYNKEIYNIYYSYTILYKSVFEYNLFEYNNKSKDKSNININLDEDNDDEY